LKPSREQGDWSKALKSIPGAEAQKLGNQSASKLGQKEKRKKIRELVRSYSEQAENEEPAFATQNGSHSKGSQYKP